MNRPPTNNIYPYAFPFQIGNIYDFTDKTRLVKDISTYMLTRTNIMFDYDGLPETIPRDILEIYLQTTGKACITEVDGKLLALCGNFSEEPNEYYLPKKFYVANPYIPSKYTKAYEVGKDCVIMKNDTFYKGINPIISKYSTLLADSIITMRMLDINTRAQNVFKATSDKGKASAELFQARLEDGKTSVIVDPSFIDGGVETMPYGNGGSMSAMTSEIEYNNYIMAMFYNELGVRYSGNMKRESLNKAETEINDDSVLPILDIMLRCREDSLKEVNAMFGTNISVRPSSSWEQLERESEVTEETPEENPEEETATEETNTESEESENVSTN